MTRTNTRTSQLLAVWLALGILAVGHPVDVLGKPHIRRIHHDMFEAEPIADQLLPDDEVVVLKEDGLTMMEKKHPPTADELITWAAWGSNLIAVVEVKDTHSHLTERGGWIRTSLRGTVREILHSDGSVPATLNEPFEAEMEGGELQIGKVRIRSEIAGPLVPARRYLLFFERNTPGTCYYMYYPLLVTGEKVKTVDEDASHDPASGLKLQEIAKIIQRARAPGQVIDGVRR